LIDLLVLHSLHIPFYIHFGHQLFCSPFSSLSVCRNLLGISSEFRSFLIACPSYLLD
jgi:hypothetical protein